MSKSAELKDLEYLRSQFDEDSVEYRDLTAQRRALLKRPAKKRTVTLDITIEFLVRRAGGKAAMQTGTANTLTGQLNFAQTMYIDWFKFKHRRANVVINALDRATLHKWAVKFVAARDR